MSCTWLTEDEQRAWRAYPRAQTMLAVRLARQLQADSGLSLPEYEVLVHLSEAPAGRLRPFQLGSDLGWEQSRMSHQLSRMARRGFVSRCSLEDLPERNGVAALDLGVYSGELRVALGDVDDRGHHRGPPGRAQQVAGVRQERREVAFEEPVSGTSCSALIREAASSTRASRVGQ